MMHRIRHAVALTPPVRALTGIVEADETYCGGKIRGVGSRHALADKTPIVTLVERNGGARSQVVADVTAKNIRQILWSNVDPEANIMTDESPVYVGPARIFDSHETVNQGAKEYSRDGVHINTAEGFFSQVKRSTDGTHHHVSRKHLHRYVSEFDRRYSTRKASDSDRTKAMIKKARGKRLMYDAAKAER